MHKSFAFCFFQISQKKKLRKKKKQFVMSKNI